MIERKLLPCPFCGGKAKMFKSYEYSDNFPVYWVECEDILCCGSAQMAHKISTSERWNKRSAGWISVVDSIRICLEMG